MAQTFTDLEQIERGTQLGQFPVTQGAEFTLGYIAGTVGQVPTIQADGNIIFADASGGSLPTGSLGDELFHNGTEFVKVTPVKNVQTITGTTITLPLIPITGSQVDIYLNGSLQEEGAGNDYTISGATITWLSSLTVDKVTTIYKTS